MIRIEQIGNGGGLDLHKTNTSFVLHNNKGPFALIDCGFNVPVKLEELDYIKDIEYVFITHKHMDHIGGLESLIYSRFFKYCLKTTVIMDSKVYNDIGEQFFEHYNVLKDGSKYKYVNMVRIEHMVFDNDLTYDGRSMLKPYNIDSIYGIEGQHGNVVNVGFIFIMDDTAVMFTGDTNATLNIKNTIKELYRNYNKVIVFHDYSNWDNPVENTHCCESQFKIYNDIINDDIIIYKVHDSSDKLLDIRINQ